MTDYKEIEKQKLKEYIQTEIEDSFKLILDEYDSLDKRKEIIKDIDKVFDSLFFRLHCLLEPVTYGYDKLQDMKRNLYIQKIQVVLAQLYKDLSTYYIETYKEIGVKFVEFAIKDALYKIKNYRID